MFVPRCGAKVMIGDIDQAKGQKASKSVREMTKNPNVVFCHVAEEYNLIVFLIVICVLSENFEDIL